MIIYSLFEYLRTHNTSIKQRNETRYPKYEYSYTHNTSIAGELIWAQAEQIREDPAEYVARKYGIRGDADGHNKGIASGVPE